MSDMLHGYADAATPTFIASGDALCAAALHAYSVSWRWLMFSRTQQA